MARRFAMTLALGALVVGGGITTALARQGGRPDPQALLAAQRDAMKHFEKLHGQWRGPAWTILPNGEKHELTQTERVGPFLDGAVLVIEGKGFEPDGAVGFNAFGIISFNAMKRAYSMRSYAMGFEGDYVVTPTDDGFTWEIPAGPMTMRYTQTIKDGKWHEVGDRFMPGRDEPVRFFEMTLQRVGDCDWPAAGGMTAE
ncbi:MAG: hypothetical protein KDA20_01320 [Phycisphaerales bacterium]|nr:hypothetical protein [Phycisphaerales bacterium]